MMNQELSAEEVARFLAGHPDFFARYPALLSDLKLPDPHTGRAVSLAERQLAVLRDRVAQFEFRLTELTHNSESNATTIGKIHQLALGLLRPPDSAGRATLIATLLANLTEDFAVPHVALRLWGVLQDDGQALGDEYEPVSDKARTLVAGLKRPQCSASVGGEIAGWFDADAELRSLALIPLRDWEADCGVIALGSFDAQRFHVGMDTHILGLIGDLASAALLRITTQ